MAGVGATAQFRHQPQAARHPAQIGVDQENIRRCIGFQPCRQRLFCGHHHKAVRQICRHVPAQAHGGFTALNHHRDGAGGVKHRSGFGKAKNRQTNGCGIIAVNLIAGAHKAANAGLQNLILNRFA